MFLYPQVHSVLFLNVPCFGSGTRPWNSAKGAQRIDDGLIEVRLIRLLVRAEREGITENNGQHGTDPWPTP